MDNPDYSGTYDIASSDHNSFDIETEFKTNNDTSGSSLIYLHTINIIPVTGTYTSK